MKRNSGLLLIGALVGINLWMWPYLIGEMFSNDRVGQQEAEASFDGQADLLDFRVASEDGEFLFQFEDVTLPLDLIPDQIEIRIGAPEESFIHEGFITRMERAETRALQHLHGPLSIHYLARSGSSCEMTYAAKADILNEDWWDDILPAEKSLQNYHINSEDGTNALLIHTEQAAETGFIHITLTKAMPEEA